MPDGFRPARAQHTDEHAYHIALGHGTGEDEGDALVLLCDDSQPRDPGTLDTEAPLALQLIALKRLGPGVNTPRVTLQGYAPLKSTRVPRARRGMLVVMA